MKDSRLVSSNGYLIKRDNDIAEGRSASKEPWFEEVVASISQWSPLDPVRTTDNDMIQDVREFLLNFKDLKHEILPGRQVAILKGVPIGLPDEIDTVVAGEHEAVSNRAACVWGTVLGRICTSQTCSTLKIEVAWRLAANNEVSAEAFLGELSLSLQQPTNNIVDGLVTIVREIAEHPESCMFSAYRADALQVLKEWKRETSLISIWTFPAFNAFNRYFPPYCEQVAVLEALRRVDPSHYLTLLEETSIPPLIKGSFSQFDIVNDFDAILELLSVAPISMERNEAGLPKWNRNVTAALLLGMCIEHVYKLGNLAKEPLVDGDDKTTQQDEETKRLFSHLADVLLSRDDGVFLALHWLCHLVS